MLLFLSTWGLLFLAAFLDVVAIVVIKFRLNEIGAFNYQNFTSIIKFSINVISTPQTFLSALMILVISPICFAIALSRINLSTAYPIVIGMGCLFLIMSSYFFLNESFTIKKLFGALLIIIGIYFTYK